VALALVEVLANETERHANKCFTGSVDFKGSEIEVFEMTDSTTLHANPARLRLRNCKNEKGGNQG
jgi:hypothetical protein